ncbi:MAG: hypothetical protein IKC03_05660, partial [Oscillospiraceae bacterium]|nr:hypothetical protein [Oscillospiraceae bacterium]
MKLYHITKWFDKDHPDAYDKVNYGFLDDSLFFHRSAIVRGSALLEKDTLEGLWVICEEIPSRKKAGSFEASNVKLFEEASAEEKSAFLAEVSLDDPVFSLLSGNPVVKEIFLQRCQQDPLSHLLNDAFRSNADVQKILMQRLSQAAKDEIDNLFVNRSLSDLSFVLPYKYPVVKDQLRELFLQKCHTAPLSQLWNDDFLSDSEVQEIFVQRLSQADKEEIFKGFAHSSLSDLSSVLPDKYPVVKDQLRELFLQKCHTAPLFLLLDDRYLSDADAQEILVQRLSQATKEETDKLFSNRSLSDLSITLPKKYPILKERLREIFLQRCQQESLSSLLEDAYLSDPDVQEIVLQRYQQIPLHTLVNLPSFSHPVIKKMVLQQCRQMPLSKLLDASYLSHTEIKEIIL